MVKDLPMHVEHETVEGANSVDMTEYRSLGIKRTKDGQDVYAFVRRANRQGL